MMMEANELYIGLMSGTSLDAIDAVLIDFTNHSPHLLSTHQHRIPGELRQHILDLYYPGNNAIQRMGETDVKLGQLFADSANELIKKSHHTKQDIRAIGSHGQTIRHMPASQHPFTLQIGDPNVIAVQTGITTVADFRRRDMALGGQAAPLAPAFHDYLCRNRNKNIGILNIGGIANVTFLPADKEAPIIGFDTGPGNTLMDAWCLQHMNTPYDKNGEWALRGTCDNKLLKYYLADPYFQKPPPKSIGCEYFYLDKLQQNGIDKIRPTDVQATLLELTAQSIANALQHFQISQLWVCGGGVHNAALMQRLNELGPYSIHSTEALGIHPDWIEATAFAWLARQTILGKPGNIPSVTGARTKSILGAIYHQ